MADLLSLETLLNVIRKEVMQEIKLHTLQVFVAIANAGEPIDSVKLMKRCSLDQRTLNRDVILLAVRVITDEDGTRKRTGFGLVEARPDMYETRRLAYSLTQKGKELFEKMVKIYNK
ncbi:MAG TPA: hypothetical protein DIT39_07020 [Tissierellales bacterium]|nr:hypothetical protein [Tissierellales bacterium]